jgi:hypothetical protein
VSKAQDNKRPHGPLPLLTRTIPLVWLITPSANHRPGNILDNADLLSTLEGTKSKAVELAARLGAARATASEIDDARVRYSPVAARGAGLFFCMAALSALNPMYEYSLSSFLGVFNGVRGLTACRGTGLRAG